MSAIEWSGKLKWVGTAAEALKWLGWLVACLCSVKRSQGMRLVSPIHCFLHRLHSIIYVRFDDLQVICYLICLTSPVVEKVLVVRPLSIWQQLRHSCFELQREVQGCLERWVRLFNFCMNQEITKISWTTVCDNRSILNNIMKTFWGVKNVVPFLAYFSL